MAWRSTAQRARTRWVWAVSARPEPIADLAPTTAAASVPRAAAVLAAVEEAAGVAAEEAVLVVAVDAAVAAVVLEAEAEELAPMGRVEAPSTASSPHSETGGAPSPYTPVPLS